MIDLRNGDCLDEMAKLEDGTVDVVITDPPYNYEFIGKTWDREEIDRRMNKVKNSKTLIKNIPYGSSLMGGVRDDKWYAKQRDVNEKYKGWVKQWSDIIYPKMKTGGHFLVFNSSRSSAHVQCAMEESGFYTKDVLVYRRNSGIPKGISLETAKKKGRYEGDITTDDDEWRSSVRNEYESIILAQKPLERNYLNNMLKYNTGMLHVSLGDSVMGNIFENMKRDDVKLDHCTPKPLSLMKRIVGMCRVDDSTLVLDPFMGSGTTGLACKELNCSFIGIEKDEKYFHIAKDRIENSKTPKTKKGESKTEIIMEDLFE